LGRTRGARGGLGAAGSGGFGRDVAVLAHALMVEAVREVERKIAAACLGVWRRPAASNLLTVSARRYEPSQIEPKWQEVWERERTWEVTNQPDDREKSYIL